MQTAKAQQLEYNLQVLRRRDASITQILGMAGHVVLYQFNEETKAWDRRNVEGSLFVVERSSEPKNQFVVINRLSSENLVETVDANFQVGNLNIPQAQLQVSVSKPCVGNQHVGSSPAH